VPNAGGKDRFAACFAASSAAAPGEDLRPSTIASARRQRQTKARVWATAAAYNSANRQPGQHQGPLTWGTMRVLRALLWRFHGADGGGRCFPGYEKIAAAAKCCRDTVNVAIKALEDAGILTWVNRIARIRRRERDLLGQLVSIWQVIRTSNAYRFIDPLSRLRQGAGAPDPGGKGYKSENPARPQNRDFKSQGARLDGARVIQEEPSRGPPVPMEPPAVAPRREPGSSARAKLSATERAAIVGRMDAGTATRADWTAWERDLETRLTSAT